MAERTTITQQVQLGVETTPGTGVAANKLLQAMSIDLKPDGGIDVFRAAGAKFPALAVLGKEFAGGGAEGQPTYTEIVYPLSGILGPATITTPATGVLSRDWDWDISTADVQDPKTFTIERGSSIQAEKVVGAAFTGLGMEYTRDELSLTGDVIAQAFTTGATMTPAPTALALVPVLPKEVDVFLDDTAAGIGTTKLLRALDASWNLSDRFGAVWPLNSALASYAALIETEPKGECGLTLEADASGMALFATMRAGTTKFLRIKATGSIIEGALTYELVADFAVKVTEIPDFSDEDGVYAVGWGFQMFGDPVWAKVGHIRVRTILTAL